MRRALLAATLCAFGAGTAIAADAPPDGDGPASPAHTYAGTRTIHHVVFDKSERNDSSYDAVYDAVALRSEVRGGPLLTIVESRHFTLRSGTPAANAALTERIEWFEHIDDDGSARLRSLEVERSDYGYALPCGGRRGVVCGRSPFSGIDERTTIARFDDPPMLDLPRAGTHENSGAQTIVTTIRHESGETGAMPDASESRDSDGADRFDARDLVVEEHVDQQPDGSGHVRATAPGFSDETVTIEPPRAAPSAGPWTIAVGSRSTGREVGAQPYPVTTHSARVPDWYPGGTRFPKPTNLISTTGEHDAAVPEACGSDVAGRRVRGVFRSLGFTRIDGIVETESETAYVTRTELLCTIDHRRTEYYDYRESGRETAATDETTILGRRTVTALTSQRRLSSRRFLAEHTG